MSSIQSIQSCNDFVIKFANINGSGSASANELFARAIMGMGVPVAPRNIFPSNIQGLPTWYEMRVSGEGWLGRQGGCDLMVAMIDPEPYFGPPAGERAPASRSSRAGPTCRRCRCP